MTDVVNGSDQAAKKQSEQAKAVVRAKIEQATAEQAKLLQARSEQQAQTKTEQTTQIKVEFEQPKGELSKIEDVLEQAKADQDDSAQEYTADTFELAMIKAVENAEQKAMKTLLDHRPELINLISSKHKMSMFELALSKGFTNLALDLINTKGFNPNPASYEPLRLAIDLGYLEIAKRLIELGSNTNGRSFDTNCVLLLCLEKEYFELAELMIRHGAEVDIRNNEGWTPLIWAAIKGRKTAVEFLLKHGASVHIRNNDGWNAIIGAFFKQRTEIVEILRKTGAVFGVTYSEAALQMAYERGQLKLVDQLLEQGISPNTCDNNGNSLLVKTVEKGHFELAKKLIALGADVNCRAADSMPLLGQLALTGNNELIKLAVEAGADVNLTSNAGITPLMVAAHEGYEPTVKYLLAQGAYIYAKDENKLTAKAHARAEALRDESGELLDGPYLRILKLLTPEGRIIDAD